MASMIGALPHVGTALAEENPIEGMDGRKPGERLHVVFATQFALPKICGIAAIVDQLSREIVARGHRVTVLASTYHQVPRSAGELPYDLVTIPAWNPLEDRFGIPYPFFSPRLRGLVRSLLSSVDVFHSQGFLSQLTLAGFSGRRSGGRPVRVLTEHVAHAPYDSRLVDMLERAVIATLGRHTAQRADAVVTYNERVAGEMVQLAPRTLHVQIENGVDQRQYHPPSEGEKAALRRELGWDDRPRVLFVGRIVDKKGAPIALQAARLGGGEFELVLAGPGSILPQPHVEFLGPLAPEAVARLYRAADLFVLPSHGEGFPLSAQEAMASGLAVILSDEPPYHAILQGAGGGARLIERTPEALVQAIRESLPIAPAAGMEALAFVTKRFSWGRAAEEHLALYRRLLGARKAARL